MQNQILNIVFIIFSGIAEGLALLQMLEVSTDRIKKSIYILHWSLLAFLPALVNVLGDGGATASLVKNILYWGLALVAIVFFYSDPVWKRLAALFLISFGLMSSELLVLIFVKMPGAELEMLKDKSSDISVLFVGIGTCFSVISMSIIVLLWRKFFRRGFSFKHLGLFLFYTIYYMASIAIMQREIWNNDFTSSSAWVILTNLLCVIMWPVIIFSQKKKR